MHTTKSSSIYKGLQSAASVAEETEDYSGGSTQVYKGTALDRMAQMLEMLMEDPKRCELEIVEE